MLDTSSSFTDANVLMLAQQLLDRGLIKSFSGRSNSDRYFACINADDELMWYESKEQAESALSKILNECLLREVNSLDTEPPTPRQRDRNAAARALMELGWTLEEVAAVFDYVQAY